MKIETPKTTLVIGASENPERYSNKAIISLVKHGHRVYAIGARNGKVAGIPIFTEKVDIPDLHTISIYLSAKNQEFYYDYFIAQKPKRIIFNPGAENKFLSELCSKNNIEVIKACTLVMLSIGAF